MTFIIIVLLRSCFDVSSCRCQITESVTITLFHS